jgi:hypothetical protein
MQKKIVEKTKKYTRDFFFFEVDEAVMISFTIARGMDHILIE